MIDIYGLYFLRMLTVKRLGTAQRALADAQEALEDIDNAIEEAEASHDDAAKRDGVSEQ